MTCPCGSGLTYDACCGRFHRGLTTAPTVEALMRSRYAAFATGEAGYLLATWHPSTRPKRLVLDPDQHWQGLTIVSAHGGFLDTEGTVEFRATWTMGGRTDVLHETSRFVREDGAWLYVSGLVR